jgi:hypothetical protein
MASIERYLLRSAGLAVALKDVAVLYGIFQSAKLRPGIAWLRRGRAQALRLIRGVRHVKLR